MNKLMCDKHKKIAVYGIGFFMALVLIVFMLTVGVPHYDTNDDVTLNNIAVGNYGEQNKAYLVFSNICYGGFISILYSIVGSVNWYAVFPIAMAFFAFLMLVYLFLKHSPNFLGAILGSSVIFLFGPYVFINIQFTHLAGFFSAIGLFFMYVGLMEDDRISKLFIYAGSIFAFLGFCFRKDAFLSIAAIVGVCCLIKIIRCEFWKLEFKQIFKYAFPFVILFVAIVIATVINNYVYQSNPQWQYWTEYNTLRAGLLDYPMPSFKSYSKKYLAIGIDKKDLEMLFSWNYADKDKFSITTLKKLYELQQEYQNEMNSSIKDVVFGFARKVLSSLVENEGFLFVAILGAGLAFWNKKNLWILVPAAVLAIELFYLSYVDRFLFRTYFGMWLALCFVVLYELIIFAPAYKCESLSKALAFIMAFIIFITPGLYTIRKTGRETKKSISKYIEKYDWRQVLSQDEDTLYVHETLYDGGPESLFAFQPVQKFNHNIYCLGGWTNPAPLQEYLLEKHGVEDMGVIRGLLDKDKSIYYIEFNHINYRERFLTYLRKEFSEDIQMECINSIDDLNVYRFFSDKNYNIKDSSKLEEIYNFDAAIRAKNVKCSFTLFENGDNTLLQGWCYSPDIDSYKQNMWLQITDGKKKFYIRGSKTIYKKLAKTFDDLHAPASGATFEIDKSILSKLKKPKFEIIIHANEEMIIKDISSNIIYK